MEASRSGTGAANGLPMELLPGDGTIVPTLLNAGTDILETWSHVDVTIDDFFRANGAQRPPVPCDHCRRFRLQCIILQTTLANPNPVSCCSSCAALFRDCSLAEAGKRVPSSFESPGPVIGQLHSIGEVDGHFNSVLAAYSQVPAVAANSTAQASNKRATSRSVHKTRLLKSWLLSHLDYPYPSEREKAALARESGLSKSQVTDWFNNARRRQRQSTSANKLFSGGSPMPSPPSAMTPLERWRNSPPDQDPVSASVIESALQIGRNASMPDLGSDQDTRQDGSIVRSASSAYGPAYSHRASSNSGSSSCFSYDMAAHDPDLFSLSFVDSLPGSEDSQYLTPFFPEEPRQKGPCAYECTFCLKSFPKKHDWLRHEQSVHMPGIHSWVCGVPLPPTQSQTVWQVHKKSSECIFCGEESPDAAHFQSHEFDACTMEADKKQTFARKDHLWQHLYKFHGCRKWDGWKPDLSLLQRTRDSVQSRCGFCQADLDSWQKRIEHVAQHFRAGLTMLHWVGEYGLNQGPTSTALVGTDSLVLPSLATVE